MAVSEECKNTFLKKYPSLKDKVNDKKEGNHQTKRQRYVFRCRKDRVRKRSPKIVCKLISAYVGGGNIAAAYNA